MSSPVRRLPGPPPRPANPSGELHATQWNGPRGAALSGGGGRREAGGDAAVRQCQLYRTVGGQRLESGRFPFVVVVPNIILVLDHHCLFLFTAVQSKWLPFSGHSLPVEGHGEADQEWQSVHLWSAAETSYRGAVHRVDDDDDDDEWYSGTGQ